MFLDHNWTVAWPVAEIRELWLRSVDLISDATVRDGEPDAGFKEWLWLQTQRRFSADHEIGYAINPFMMWQSALVTGCAGEKVVCSNPRRANAIEINRIASYAVEISETSEKCEDEAKQCRLTAQEMCRVRDEMDSQPASLEVHLARGKAMVALQNYRKAEVKRFRLRSLADVVVCFESALIPLVHLVRPAGDVHTPESITHFRRVAVELTNFANSKATGELMCTGEEDGKPAVEGQPEAISEPPKPVGPQASGNDTEGKPDRKPSKQKRSEPRRTSEELFKSAMRTHHKYEVGGSVMNSVPISPRQIETLTGNAISDTTAGRLLKRHFGSIENYKQACFEETIGRKLVVLLGDGLHAFGSFDQTKADVDDAADGDSDD